MTKPSNYFTQFQATRLPVMAEIKQEGIANKVPIVSDDIGILIKLICSIHKPSLVLEIGCGISYATHWMLSGHSEARFISIDSNRDRIGRCDFFLNKSGYRDQVELIHGWADAFFESNDKKFDLIVQDATKRDYVNMIDYCYDSLKIGGFFFADNLLFGGKVIELLPEQQKKYTNGVAALKRFTELISQHPGFECSFFDYGDGALVAKRIK